jgi:fused signal recognition particle receptor
MVMSEDQGGFFARLKDGLKKTREDLKEKIDSVFALGGRIDEDTLEQLEEVLITSDVGVGTTMDIIDRLRKSYREQKPSARPDPKEMLKEILIDILGDGQSKHWQSYPLVLLIVGVNGVGKTTTIGKLASMYKDMDKRVLLAAADTYRAAAIEQLEVWSNRVGVELIKQSQGSDPAAVVFDAVNALKARRADVLICDTAGRLHNKRNLMEELKKVQRVINRELDGAAKETYLVLDASTGQNAIVQADMFKEFVDVTGIIITKLDGTAKGGMVFSIKDQLNIPVRYIGVGEGMDDLQPFDSRKFVEALF